MALAGMAEGDDDDDPGDNDPDPEPTASKIAVVSESTGEVRYAIDLTATSVSKAGEGDLAAEDNDEIRDNGDGTYTIDGFTGNAGFGDTFEYTGTVEEVRIVSATAEYRIEIDGEDVTEEIVAEPSGDSPLGGGQGYADAVYLDDADYTAADRSELDSALSRASSGDVVFLTGDLPRDGSGDGITVPSGVTLASGRGTSDPTATIRPRGGRNYTTYGDLAALNVQGNARVTGLVIDGYETGYRRHNDYGGYMIWGRGISLNGSGIRVDNCEVLGNERGFADAGGNVIEYCHIHHHLQGGMGYGVYAGDGTEVRFNRFDYNRHSIACGGNEGFHVHDNWFGSNHVGHVIDHHGNENGALDRAIEINNNRVEQYLRPHTLPGPNGGDVEVRNAGGPAATVDIRDAPSGRCEIHHNWTNHPDGPFPDDTDECIGQGSWHRPAITQMENVSASCSSYQGTLDVYANHYGSSTPTDTEIGPRV